MTAEQDSTRVTLPVTLGIPVLGLLASFVLAGMTYLPLRLFQVENAAGYALTFGLAAGIVATLLIFTTGGKHE